VVEGLIFPEPVNMFLSLVTVLAIGHIVNTNTIPVFLYAQGAGILRWNIIGQLCIAFVTVAAISTLPLIAPVQAAPAGISIGLTFGSCVMFLGNSRFFQLGGVFEMIRRSILAVISVGFAAGVSGIFLRLI
jgi:hypothetical protein